MTASLLEDLLGHTHSMRVLRLGPHGAMLGLEDPSGEETSIEVLLPRAEVDAYLLEGDLVEAFLYLDSEDRPVATLRPPVLERGEVAFLEVRDVTPIGAFCAWGPLKELLIPFKEQTRELSVGDYEPIGLGLDRTDRLVGTMRIRELLDPRPGFAKNSWVDGEAWRFEPEIGLFVILGRRALGLVPAHEPHGLRRGEKASFRVTHVQPDGKVELSLRGLSHEELSEDAERILSKLRQASPPLLSDHASPEEIRALFGLSKKAFKRAMGRLLKEGSVTFDAQGNFVAK